jgi:hypothetical protein
LNKSLVRSLPFHEVFKGSILGPWKYYKEERAEAINILNAGFNSKSLQFLRVYVLKFLFYRAKDKNTIETPVKKIAEFFSPLGASENHILKVLSDLYQNRLINSIDSKNIEVGSTVAITLSGGYYYTYLIKSFEYLESVLYDTPIFIDEHWDLINSISEDILHENNIVERVKKRSERTRLFLNYIKGIEQEGIKQTQLAKYSIYEEIDRPIQRQLYFILLNAKSFY